MYFSANLRTSVTIFLNENIYLRYTKDFKLIGIPLNFM